MTHNKGATLTLCKECKKKRFCRFVQIPGYNFRWICSIGHSWITEGITLQRVNAVIKDIFSEDKLKDLFNRDNPLYKQLKKKQ